MEKYVTCVCGICQDYYVFDGKTYGVSDADFLNNHVYENFLDCKIIAKKGINMFKGEPIDDTLYHSMCENLHFLDEIQ